MRNPAMILFLILSILLSALSPAPVLAAAPWGLISQYDPGIMPRVIANRIHWGQLPRHGEATVFLAGPDCTAIGEMLWIRPRNWRRRGWRAHQRGMNGESDNRGWERAIIADCPGDRQAAEFLASLGWPYEVDGATVARWGYPRGRGVSVQISYRWPVELHGEMPD